MATNTSPNQQIDIVFKDVKFDVYDKSIKGFKPILKGVTGQVKSGQCLAIMGASGAGKSTLMNIMAGRIVNGSNTKVSGDILFNGEKFSPSEISNMSGYVLQTDILIEFLTVQGKLQNDFSKQFLTGIWPLGAQVA